MCQYQSRKLTAAQQQLLALDWQCWMDVILINSSGHNRDVNETLAYKTETFGFWSEMRPRPSCNSMRPRRLIFATRRDRDLARPRLRRFLRPSTFQPFRHNRHGPKTGGLRPFSVGELGFHLAHGQGRGTMWHLDALALQ